MHFAESLEARLLLAGEPKFVTPIAGMPYQDFSIYTYFDVNPAAGAAKDYKNGPYAFDGYQGTDYTLPSFAQMDAGVNVLAGAAGVVTYVHDGEFDRNTTLDPNRVSNEIVIDHGNNWKTVYLHLKRGSINVAVGQQVTAGQAIAKVGASGNTDGPAVQFIVLHNGVPVDPYSAPSTFWQSPMPYMGDVHGLLDSGVSNRPTSPLIFERPDNSPTFSQASGQTAYLWGIFYGVKTGDLLDYKFYKPDGSLHHTLPITADGNYQFAYYFASTSLGTSPAAGTWHAKIFYDGQQIADKPFVVSAAGSPEIRVSLGSEYVRNGRSTPIDFPGTYPGGINLTRTFTILNRGTSTLNISQVQLPAGFTLQSAPPATVAPGVTATFGMQLNTGAPPGTKSGNVVVKTNDADDANYTFAVEGVVHAAAPKAVIKGSVFNDPNSDGLRSLGESAVNNVTVYIDANNNNALDAGETSTKTSASGEYQFANLNPGSYRLRVVLPAGLRRTMPMPENFRIATVSNAGQVVSNADFSLTSNILLAGVVFNDANGNGVKDAGEAAMQNVTVEVLSNNVIVATRTTDSAGAWRVRGLGAGTGVARIVIPAGFNATYPAGGQYAGSMSAGQQNQNVNFGLKKTSPAPQFTISLAQILTSAELDDFFDSPIEAA